MDYEDMIDRRVQLRAAQQMLKADFADKQFFLGLAKALRMRPSEFAVSNSSLVGFTGMDTKRVWVVLDKAITKFGAAYGFTLDDAPMSKSIDSANFLCRCIATSYTDADNDARLYVTMACHPEGCTISVIQSKL